MNNNMTPEQKAEGYTRKSLNDKVSNFYQNVSNISKLEDLEGLKNFADGLDKVTEALDAYSASIMKTAESEKEGRKQSDEIQNINRKVAEAATELLKAQKEGAVDFKTSSKIIKSAMDTLQKNQSKFNKQTNDAIKEMLDNFGEIADAAENVSDDLKKSSDKLSTVINENIKALGSGIRDLSNFLNLNKLVTGGRSVSDLRDMQHAVKVDLGINQNEFMSLQGSMVETNREIGAELGLSFRDTINYLSSIKDYNFKNYNQTKAMYTQVSLGTKYLGLSNANMNSLVKATNALADDSYMNRQLAIMSAMSANSTIAENMGDIADFLGTNSTAVAARYSNYQDMLTGAVAIKTTSDALLGNESKLIENLMSEIMGATDYSQLSQQTQTLLAYTGQTSNVWSQMRNGNLDFNTIIPQMMQVLSERSTNNYNQTALESMGLGQWVTVAGNYRNNQEEFNKVLGEQTGLLENIDVTDEKQLKEYQKMLTQGKDDRTFLEKMEDGLFDFLGIQNRNWTELLGIVQILQLVEGALVTYSTLTQNTLLKSILAAILKKGATDSLSGGLGNSLLSKLGLGGAGGGLAGGIGSLLAKMGITGAGGTALSGGQALLAGGGLLGGIAGLGFGISDAITNMMDQSVKVKPTGNKMIDGLLSSWLSYERGMFMGNTYKGNENNFEAGVGNTLKWGGIGAGVGTLVGGPVGTLVGGGIGLLFGGIMSLIGSNLEKNTEALQENTDVIGESSDSIVKNSGMLQKYNYYVNGARGAAPITHGTGSVTSSFGVGESSYPWRVTSPYGPRWGTTHSGIDFGVPIGTKVGMPVNGTVTYTQNDPRNTWATKDASAGTGAYILGDNGIKYIFWHLSSLNVKDGQRVGAGQLVGLTGNTGYSSGPHLHFGVTSGGKMTDPEPYINSNLFNPSDSAVVQATEMPQQNNSDFSTITNGKSIRSTKDSSFMPSGDVQNAGSSMIPNYATSADIDRLINEMKEMNKTQQDQRSFLQALQGKNHFVLH